MRSMLTRFLELQRVTWNVAARAALLPVTSLVRRSDRHLAWRLFEVCCGGQRPGVYPELALAALVDRATSASIAELPTHHYHVTEMELLALAAMTSRVRAHTVFEFGTADGRTTRNLAANIDPSGHVYTLNILLDQDDTHRQEVPLGYRFQDCPETNRITQLLGDSRTFEFRPYLGRCQVVFIDADHADSSVWIDSRTALQLVDTKLGIILWHDALRYGVQTALPRLMHQYDLPIHLISGTNLALLCFANDKAMMPATWAKEISERNSALVTMQDLAARC